MQEKLESKKAGGGGGQQLWGECDCKTVKSVQTRTFIGQNTLPQCRYCVRLHYDTDSNSCLMCTQCLYFLKAVYKLDKGAVAPLVVVLFLQDRLWCFGGGGKVVELVEEIDRTCERIQISISEFLVQNSLIMLFYHTNIIYDVFQRL